MATITTRPWDAAEHLETLEDVVEYLDGAREEGDPRLEKAAFADVMRSPAIKEGPCRAGVECGCSRTFFAGVRSTDAGAAQDCAEHAAPTYARAVLLGHWSAIGRPGREARSGFRLSTTSSYGREQDQRATVSEAIG